MAARNIVVVGIASLSLVACAQQDRPDDTPPVTPAAEAIGPAQSCIPLNQISSTRVRDDFTIDFMGAGDKVWRNTMPNRCPGLKSGDGFSYTTSLSQLCGSDIIHVLQRVGGETQRAAGCGLGQFVPVKLADK